MRSLVGGPLYTDVPYQSWYRPLILISGLKRCPEYLSSLAYCFLSKREVPRNGLYTYRHYHTPRPSRLPAHLAFSAILFPRAAQGTGCGKACNSCTGCWAFRPASPDPVSTNDSGPGGGTTVAQAVAYRVPKFASGSWDVHPLIDPLWIDWLID